MAEAFNVRSNGQKYYVYRIDGNVQVAEFDNAAEAQRSAAIQNQRWNERFGKKKDEPVASPDSASDAGVQTRAYPEPQKQGKKVPDPPPGQGTSY